MDEWGLLEDQHQQFVQHSNQPTTAKLDQLIEELRDIASSQPTSPFSSPVINSLYDFITKWNNCESANFSACFYFLLHDARGLSIIIHSTLVSMLVLSFQSSTVSNERARGCH